MLAVTLILSGLIATMLMVMVQKLYVTVSQNGITLTRFFSYLLAKKASNEKVPPAGGFQLYVGFFVCYILGVLFIVCYYLLWRLGIGKSDIITALGFGTLHGLLSILLVKIILKNRLASVGVNIHFYISLFLSHIMFSLTATVMFNFITQLNRIGQIQP